MPSERRGVLRLVLTVLLIVAGILLVNSLGVDLQTEKQSGASSAPASVPRMHLKFGRNQLDVFVNTVSAAHKNALHELLADQFADSHIESKFREGLLLSAEWEVITTRLLYVVAATSSATATGDKDRISIHATTRDLQEYQSRLMLLQDALNSDIQLVSEITSAVSDVPVQDLCARNFAAITERTNGTRQVLQFRQSGTALGESAHALLDKLAEFAYDCQEARIAILGHTDSTGEESWNVQVSEMRAKAVAAQLVSRGIAAERLLVEGRGSQSPLAENDTVQGRAQNRRIEFELR
jgi:outer membrane protein OmpA-like peptidoglycan-associated protein